MERFLKKKQNNSPCQNDQSATKAAISDSTTMSSEKFLEAVTFSIDCALSQNDEINTDDIRKSHFTSWHHLGQIIRSNRKHHWGICRKPKTALIKELKLTNTRGLPRDDEMNVDKLVDVWEETVVDDRTCQTNADSSVSCAQKSYRS